MLDRIVKRERLIVVRPTLHNVSCILGEPGEPDDLLFGPLDDRHLRTLLRKYVAKGVADVHGFRSTLSTWAADHEYPSEVHEMALSHAVGDTVERAYQRSKLLERRRKMMEQWSAFCCSAA